jgi:hypothetical protein
MITFLSFLPLYFMDFESVLIWDIYPQQRPFRNLMCIRIRITPGFRKWAQKCHFFFLLLGTNFMLINSYSLKICRTYRLILQWPLQLLWHLLNVSCSLFHGRFLAFHVSIGIYHFIQVFKCISI